MTAPPSEWPTEVGDLYTSVRVIGKGGFASVWMAKRKKADPSSDEDYVAIKLCKDDGYAAREVAILSELGAKYPHPNIIRLLDHFKCKRGDARASSCPGVNCAVLSLARGPTLNYIVNKFGALGLVVAQSISRQLIDAVAFLHGHAVIHRDIQPANIIVSGTQMDDDLWWSDELDVEGKVSAVADKCHITLVDFGFARALSPNDIEADVGLKKVLDESEKLVEPGAGADGKFLDVACIDDAFNDNPKQKVQSRGRSRTRDCLDTSVSHKPVRDLSALGTRTYAAPEILSGLRNLAELMNTSIRRQKKTLGVCVSNYGMVADAFSVGATIRHMVTGVPPNMNVEEFIAGKNRLLKRLARSLKKRVKKDDKRAKKYRMSTDLPEAVQDLIQLLTHYDQKKRVTVRSATNHSWVNESASSLSTNKSEETKPGGPVVYLECGR